MSSEQVILNSGSAMPPSPLPLPSLPSCLPLLDSHQPCSVLPRHADGCSERHLPLLCVAQERSWLHLKGTAMSSTASPPTPTCPSWRPAASIAPSRYGPQACLGHARWGGAGGPIAGTQGVGEGSRRGQGQAQLMALMRHICLCVPCVYTLRGTGVYVRVHVHVILKWGCPIPPLPPAHPARAGARQPHFADDSGHERDGTS